MRRGPDALWPSRFESSIDDATHLPSLCPPSAYGRSLPVVTFELDSQL